MLWHESPLSLLSVIKLGIHVILQNQTHMYMYTVPHFHFRMRDQNLMDNYNTFSWRNSLKELIYNMKAITPSIYVWLAYNTQPHASSSSGNDGSTCTVFTSLRDSVLQDDSSDVVYVHVEMYS